MADKRNTTAGPGGWDWNDGSVDWFTRKDRKAGDVVYVNTSMGGELATHTEPGRGLLPTTLPEGTKLVYTGNRSADAVQANDGKSYYYVEVQTDDGQTYWVAENWVGDPPAARTPVPPPPPPPQVSTSFGTDRPTVIGGPYPKPPTLSTAINTDRPTVIGGVYSAKLDPGSYRPNLTSGYTDGGAGLPGMVVSPNARTYQDVVNEQGYAGLAGGGAQYDGGIYGNPNVRNAPANPITSLPSPPIAATAPTVSPSFNTDRPTFIGGVYDQPQTQVNPSFNTDRPTVIGGVYNAPAVSYVPYTANLTSGYNDGGAGLPGMIVSPNGTSYQTVTQQYGSNGLAGGGSQMPQVGNNGYGFSNGAVNQLLNRMSTYAYPAISTRMAISPTFYNAVRNAVFPMPSQPAIPAMPSQPAIPAMPPAITFRP